MFRYKSKRFSLSYGPEIMKISDNSDLRVHFGYFQEEGQTVLDVTEIGIAEDRFNQIGYTVSRVMKPPEELGDEYKNNWENMEEGRFPYNGSAYHKDKVTIISTTYRRGGKLGKGEGLSSSVLYTVGFIKEGNVDQKEMESKLDMLMRNLVVYEEGEKLSPVQAGPAK